jgi:hypothetical protein
MTPAEVAALRAELDSILADARANFGADSVRVRAVERAVGDQLAALKIIEAAARPRRKLSAKARKRKAFKRFHAIDAGAAILPQVRGLVR